MAVSVAHASPASEAAGKQAQGVRLYNRAQYDEALAVIAQGLAIVPAHTGLLELKAQVLLKLPDYLGALEAYEADVQAGATAANLRNARANIARLAPVRTTFLEITVANGPAVIHLDSRTQRVFCTAEPTCHKGWLPGVYKVIAERAGFQPWTGRVTLVAGKTVALPITLVEKPSPLAIQVEPADAQVTVDGAPYHAPLSVPAGSHRVVVALAGHVTSTTDTVAREGAPIALAITLAPRVAARVAPPSAALTLDGQPITIIEGGLAMPPGAHVLIARAPGLADRRVEIKATRPAGYTIDIALVAAAPPRVTSRWLTPRRKLALAAGGVGIASLATGALLGTQAKQREDDAFALCESPTTPCGDAAHANQLNKQGQSRALQANIAYGLGAGAAIVATVLWLTGRPESPTARASRITVRPRLGAVAGLDLALRF